MAWNEPGNNKPNDPWGGDNNRNGGRHDGPPDLDEALKQFQNKMRGWFGGSNKKSGNDDGAFNAVSMVVGILFSLWILMGAYQLDEQEQAVVLRLGVFHELVGPGFHFNFPIIDKVYKENVTKYRILSTNGQMLTEDENIVEVNLSVQYNISNLQKFKLSIRDPELALQEATDSALRHVVGSSKMDDVLTTGRQKIAEDVQLRLANYLETYQTGIRLKAVNVEDTKAPPEVKASFDDVSKAREDEERFKNEAQTYANQVVPESRGKALRMLEEAKGYREQVIAKAEGEAIRFKKLLVEYKKAPTVTRERLYLDTMQQVMQSNTKVMMDVKNGNNMMYLPLDKLMQNTLPAEPGATTNSSDSKAPSQVEMDDLRQQLESLKATINNTGPRRREVRQ